MPRQDVPYGGALCRLKERIAEIWDELGKKLHSINGVEGDAAGDVKIVSGDAAVVVTSDQVQHEIEIALDSSQLPAAAVSSVNGKTGAVVLDAGDIPPCECHEAEPRQRHVRFVNRLFQRFQHKCSMLLPLTPGRRAHGLPRGSPQRRCHRAI